MVKKQSITLAKEKYNQMKNMIIHGQYIQNPSQTY
jgi:hypothetical protein